MNINHQRHWRLTVLGVIVLSIFMISFVSGPASANNGPHGDDSRTKDNCSLCHRERTGRKVPFGQVGYLCLTCHGGGAHGAETNVIDGRDETNDAPLNGGGFSNFRGRQVTSRHSFDGSRQRAWGSAFSGTGHEGDAMVALTCTTCHEPHGARSYRLLRNRGQHGDVEYQDPRAPGHLQVVSNEVGGLDPDRPGYVPDYATPRYRDGINSWCAGCHPLYLQTVSPVDEPVDIGDGNGPRIRYRHKILATVPSAAGLTTSLPLQQPAGYSGEQQATDKLGCITCHFAHGTSAQMTGHARNVPPSNDSALLRLDNRGVCQDCHKK